MTRLFASLIQAIPRYALTVAGLLLLVLFLLLTLLPLQIVRDHLTDTAYLQGLLIWAGLALVLFVPALSMLIRKIWFFPGRAEPVSASVLRQNLLQFNDQNIPIAVQEKGKALVALWRYDDPNWCELMDLSGMKRFLEMRLLLDERTHTVTIRDRFRKVNLELCPVKVKPALAAIPGVVLAVPVETDQDPAVARLPVDYTFKPKELKSPVVNLILNQGWNVRYTLL